MNENKTIILHKYTYNILIFSMKVDL